MEDHSSSFFRQAIVLSANVTEGYADLRGASVRPGDFFRAAGSLHGSFFHGNVDMSMVSRTHVGILC